MNPWLIGGIAYLALLLFALALVKVGRYEDADVPDYELPRSVETEDAKRRVVHGVSAVSRPGNPDDTSRRPPASPPPRDGRSVVASAHVDRTPEPSN